MWCEKALQAAATPSILTKEINLGKRHAVHTSLFWSARSNGRRLIGILLFLAVFFLPLHVHSATLAAQVTKECSCVHGARTQAGLAPELVSWTPFLACHFVANESQDFPWSLSILIRDIRAPPTPAGL